MLDRKLQQPVVVEGSIAVEEWIVVVEPSAVDKSFLLVVDIVGVMGNLELHFGERSPADIQTCLAVVDKALLRTAAGGSRLGPLEGIRV